MTRVIPGPVPGRYHVAEVTAVSELLDNRAHRIRTLKEIILRLHRGEAPAAVKPQLATLVRECSASEIAAMEQELMAGGIPATEIMRMCDLHADALRDLLVAQPARTIPPGHPVDTFQRENRALEQTAARLRAVLGLLTLGRDSDPVDPAHLAEARKCFNLLMDVDKHYRRKEHLLFPHLERYGITGPSKVMWGKDDEVREWLRQLGAVLAQDGTTVGEWRLVAPAVAMPALAALEEMIFKEEKILLPMALDTLTEADWGEIWRESPQIGWCIVDPVDGWRPPAAAPAASAAAAQAAAETGVAFEGPVDRSTGSLQSGALVFPTGSLTLEQLAAIFATLPVDLTFVDAEDRVRFFTEGRHRVFVRPKAVIGRLVQHCHPPASVHVVDRILADFREGRQSVAEFWIDFRGRFVHIRYFAVRDERGRYLGTLEVTQDLTRERTLQGERRLLQYE
jgi:DUF438 domain-containing protein